MSHFFGLIRPYRSDFLTDPDPEETRIMGEHFEYLQQLLEDGHLVLAGPTTVEEDPVGVYIFEADSERDARDLFENDPAVRAGIQEIVRFQPIRLSLFRGPDSD